MKSETNITKCFAYTTLIISILALLSAAALAVILGVKGYSGLDNNLSLTATCTEAYLIAKYAASNITNHVIIAFISAIIASVLSLFIVICLICWIRNIEQGQLPGESLSPKLKMVLYIASNLLLLSSIMPVSYYLSYIRELDSCTTVVDSTALGTFTAIGAALFCFSLIFWILMLYLINATSDSQEKYKEVVSHPTEPDAAKPVQKRIQEEERGKQPYEYKNSPPKKFEQTKQNIYDSPSRRPMENSYPKTYQKDNNNSNVRRTPYQQPRNQPRTYNYGNEPKKQPIYLQKKQQGQGELMFSKKRQYRREQQALGQQQNKYLSGYGGSILPSSGMRERQPKNSEYFQSGSSPRRNVPQENVSASKGNREGVLLNYIRGKYGS